MWVRLRDSNQTRRSPRRRVRHKTKPDTRRVVDTYDRFTDCSKVIDPNDPFESALELLSWAKADADKLDKLIDAYFAGKPDQPFTRTNPRTRIKTYGAKLVRPLPSETRRHVSDCVSHLRHSLDQALYAAAKVIGKEPDGDLYFPWAESPADLEGRLRHSRMPAELHDTIRKIAPYPAGDGYTVGDTMFRELARIAGPNKHRFAIKVSPVANMATEVSYQGVQPVYLGLDKWDPSRNEVILLQRYEGSSFDFKVRVHFVVGFEHIRGLRTSGVRETIKHFVDRTENVIGELREASASIAQAR